MHIKTTTLKSLHALNHKDSDWVKVLCPTRHKQVISDMFFQPISRCSIEETKPNTKKQAMQEQNSLS